MDKVLIDTSGLGAVRGWLADDDPFLAAVEEIVNKRSSHRPRTWRKRAAAKTAALRQLITAGTPPRR